jgi:hypothetical protein
VKVSLEMGEDGTLRVDKVRLRPRASEDLRIEGALERVGPGWIGLLGLDVLVDAETEWEGLTPPAGLSRAGGRARSDRLVEGAWLSVKGLARQAGLMLAGSVEPAD